MRFMSIVAGHEGWCAPTWTNRNTINNRLDGCITGFYRKVVQRWWSLFIPVRVGPEFHACIYDSTNASPALDYIVVEDHRQ